MNPKSCYADLRSDLDTSYVHENLDVRFKKTAALGMQKLRRRARPHLGMWALRKRHQGPRR